MPRFYIPPQSISHDKVVISGPQAHQIANVLRLKKGDELTLFDGSGYEYRSQIIKLLPCKLIAHIQAKSKPAVESPANIILGQALIKANKLDMVIQKATELGVSQIVPIRCARCRRMSPEALAKKQGRWQMIVVEAAQQCGRSKLPRMDKLQEMEKFCADFETADLKLILWEQEKNGLRNTLSRVKQAEQVALLIGPEGGFNLSEVQSAQEHGFIPLGLGRRTLRAETAAIVAVSLVQYQLGDLS